MAREAGASGPFAAAIGDQGGQPVELALGGAGHLEERVEEVLGGVLEVDLEELAQSGLTSALPGEGWIVDGPAAVGLVAEELLEGRRSLDLRPSDSP